MNAMAMKGAALLVAATVALTPTPEAVVTEDEDAVAAEEADADREDDGSGGVGILVESRTAASPRQAVEEHLRLYPHADYRPVARSITPTERSGSRWREYRAIMEARTGDETGTFLVTAKHKPKGWRVVRVIPAL